MGRIEHPLLDGDKPPIRPKTAARNHTIPQKSNKCIFHCDKTRAGASSFPGPQMVGRCLQEVCPPL